MKKAIIPFICLAFLSACSEYSETDDRIEETLPEQAGLVGVDLTVKASCGENDTRTVVSSNGSTIMWSPGDAINMFYGSGSAGKFTEQSLSEPATYAEFNGVLKVVTGSNETGTGARSFWGVYPYNEANTCDGSSVTMTIPSVQSPAENTFANGLNPAVSTGPGLDLVFYNVGSWFIFTVESEGITSVTFTGNNDEDLVGKVQVTMDSEGHPAATVLEGYKSVTMNAPEGGFTPGTFYYMVILPQTLSQGYTLTMSKGEMTASFVKDGSSEFTRSDARRKLKADSGLNFAYNLTGNITFADPAVKAICVENWDTDGDGELSYTEAAAVQTIPYGVFSGNTQITSFDEFQYFTGVTKLEYDSDYEEGYEYFGAFSLSSLKSIKLPSSLKTISFGAFSGCRQLEEITIPATVTSIGMSAFHACSGLTVHMESAAPCSMFRDAYGTWDEPYAFGNQFMGGTVKVIYVPDEAAAAAYKSAQYWSTYSTIIHPEGWVDPSDIITFQDALTELYCVDNWDTNGDGKLSKGEAAAVTDIGTILQGTDIVYFEELKYFSNLSSLSDEAFKNCKYLQSISFPLNIQTIGPSLFSGCAKLNKICVPSLRMWMEIISPVKPFTSISGDLYIGDNLVTRMIIPEGTTCVNDYLCYNLSKLNSVSIPSTVTSIGNYSFYRCKGLTSVSIPQGVTAIGEYAFYGCSGISSICFPDGISSIGNSSFYSCSGLTSISLPESATSIGTYAFAYCTSIESAKLPESLTTIPDGLFSECSSLSQVYPDAFQIIGNSSFSGCAIESITVRKSIGQYSFRNCKSLSNITLEEGLYRIRRSAFSGCTSLKEITLPKSLAGSYSLCDDFNTYSGSGEYNTYGAFYGSSIEKITCYDSLLERYDLPLGEQGYYSRLVSAFYYVTEPSYKWIYNDTAETVKEITIIKTSTVYSIPARAFASFDGLETINLPSGLTSVGKDSFSGCSSLRDFVFQPTLKGIGQYAFSGCAFTSVNLPVGLSSIDMGAFRGCQYLESITIPNSVGTIADYTFSNCSSLTSIVIPDSVTSVGYYAFENCSTLTSITVPSGITSIGNFAFSGCKNLSSIFVKPVTPPAGGSNMFYNTNNCPIYVPLGTVDTYKSANIWSSYENRIQVDPSQVVHVSGVSLNASSLSLAAGATSTLIPALTPSNATDKSVTWSSSDQSVATVDAQGVVTAIGTGTASITVTTTDGGHTATCLVTVKKPFPAGTSFDPDAYITYVSNHQEWGNLSTEEDYMYDTQFSTNVSGTRIEMKFQIPDYSSGEAILSQGSHLGNGLAIDASNVYQVRFVGKHKDGDTWYNQAFDSGVGNGIDGTGVVVLTASCDGNQIVASVNGNETTIPVAVSSWSFNYLFSYYDYEGGDGSKYEYLAGVPDGAKLYYVKIWNGDDLVYFGHASRSVCSFSSEEEYCWYEEVGNKYTFARNLHTLASSEIIPYQPISPVVSVRQAFGGGVD